jgi:hypothetical protein
MGRKFKFRYEKRFFDPQLGIVGSGATRYVDAFNRDAAQRIQLQKLTSRLRLNVNMAAPPHAQIPRDAVIYGIANSKVFKPVTAETLTKRMGIAQAIAPHTVPPKDKMNYRKAVRARKLTEMHAPLLDSPNGPWETLR